MPNIINADDGSVSGIAGIKQTADSSGALILQANGVNAISISNTAAVTINGSFAAGAITATSISDSGNLTFTGTGNRITGDFSNATLANRVAFQTSTTNGNTSVGILPNGTSQTANLRIFSDSSANNTSVAEIASTAECRISSGIVGTGTFQPMTFYTGGSERLRIDTSGNVMIGTTTARGRLHSTASSFNPISGNVWASSASFTASGAFGGGLTLVDGTAGYGLWVQDAGGTFAIGQGNTSGNLTERMRIDSSGNVGIGTSSPSTFSSKLAVAGNSGTGLTQLTVSGGGNSGDYGIVSVATSTTIKGRMIADATSGDLRFDTAGSVAGGIGFYTGSSYAQRFIIGAAGQLGIGASPSYGSSGQVLTSNGSGSAPSWQNASGQGGRGQVFTSSGTFTIPTGITSLKVTVVGGGGGGGGSSTTFNFQGAAGGGSGGAGISYLTGLTPGATISVTIGAGGAGGAGGNNIGGTGGSTSVSSGTQSITTITATGGGGGASTEYSTNQTWGNTKGGNAGACSGATMNFGGNPGHNTFPGGGADGNQNVSGGGGGSIFGGGGSGRVCNQGTGIAGQAPGAGGGGASFQSAGFSGGAGAAGAVVFEW